ncbi:hypothetical protein KG088_14790 [Halomonas sp. TRM85114]|uniref:PilX N-terminal domain-containing pilus assembly protein n=1 Tax=Halomonas jincaotanensis TaxID=2810616 RepID=UPI001BD48DC5|nr:PilX N-terminal domain-containing pilus assembly protein [Halomonas jincaotanensis]MBS9404896.1 hypothetical protein [Halomonas jincaotanensis]
MKRQQGAVLVVVLSLLTVSLMVGLSSMQTSQIDERLAGNYKAAVEAQMAAEEAASYGATRIASSDSNVTYIDISGSLNESEWVANWEKFYAFASTTHGVSSEDSAKGGLSVSSVSDELSWGYVFVEDESNTRYVVGMGAQFRDGVVSVQGDPVIVEYFRPFSFNRALSVFGGIQDVNGNSWFPKSANAGINGGINGEGLFYEGDPNDCEYSSDKSQCYENLHLYGGVTYGGLENTEARDKFELLYNSISGSTGTVVTDDSNIEWIDRSANCTDQGVSQVAVLETFSAANNKKFCGVLIVWGGYVNIDDNALDTTLSGNENVDGTLIVGNYASKSDDSNNSVPDFSKQINEVDLTINGGGANGSVYFNIDVVRDSLIGINMNSEAREELFPTDTENVYSRVPSLWR